VFQYASILDETPAYLGGRENPWRLLTLEGLCSQTWFNKCCICAFTVLY